jgi:hypothetical protein
MHGALVNVTIEQDQAPAAANALTHDILPAIRSAPGVSINDVDFRRVAASA